MRSMQVLTAFVAFAASVQSAPQYGKPPGYGDSDPFAVLDEQKYVMPENVGQTTTSPFCATLIERNR